MLLASVGLGAVLGTTVVIPRLRRKLTSNALVGVGRLVYGAGLRLTTA